VRARPAWTLREDLASGSCSALEAVEAAAERARTLDPQLRAFLSTEFDAAKARATALDAESSRGPLHGLTFAVKANLCWAGAETNAASRVLAGYRAPYSATTVQRALDAGALAVGVANMDEFGFGSSGENSAFGATRNPWDLARAPGGSSSGAAAAVAAGVVAFALGSDTGGSVRQPAALCGVSGFKPSYGRLSRFGLIAFASSLDCVGVLAPSVDEIELVMGALGGVDERDSTSSTQAPFSAARRDDLRGVRIGAPREHFGDGVDPRVAECVRAALRECERLGARVREIELPHTPSAIATYYVIASAEASSNLARYDGVRYGARQRGDGTLQGMIEATRTHGFGAEARRRVALGSFVLSSGYYEAWYVHALKVRRLIANDFERAFEHVDVLVGPTSPTAAFELGERAADPLAMYASDALTVPASLAGLPALSTPCGLLREGGVNLPVGMQWIGPLGADERVLALAGAWQRSTAHHRAHPALAALSEAAR
jgi:aspartyl-tRNA(Asn)/glutamyl-tRNA(Gln) amidotransferase subunit A